MKVLVTGGTGFIGRHLISRLVDRGDTVRCLSRSNSDAELKSAGVEIARGDVTEEASIRGVVESVDVVYHLAAVGHVGANTPEAYRHFHLINVTGLRNLIGEILKNGHVQRVVHFSSTAAMGLIEGEADEESVCRPETPYQRSKFEAEQLLRQSFQDNRFPAIILRPSMVYGRGDHGPDFLSMCRMVKKGRFPLSSTSGGLTPLVHVDDVVQAALLASEHGRVGETYIITSERSYPMREIVEVVSEALDVSRGGIALPNWGMAALAWAAEMGARAIGASPALTRKRLKSILADRSFDISKAVNELGYCPRVSLRQGIADSIDWYRELGHL